MAARPQSASATRDLDAARDAAACAGIIADLPDWFSAESGILECAAAVATQDGLVAPAAGPIAGFLTWRAATPAAAEISWLAVRRARHGDGLGRALVEEVVARARAAEFQALTVWTLSQRLPDEGYAATRAFYARLGFLPLAEKDIWGPDDPAVLLGRML